MARLKDSTCPCPRCGIAQVAPGQSYCRECRTAYNQEWFRERRCSRCGVAEAKKNHCYCSRCLALYGREWRREHPRPAKPPRIQPVREPRKRIRDKFREKPRQCPRCGIASTVRGGSYCLACNAAQTLERFHARGGQAGLSEERRRLSNIRSYARQYRRKGYLKPEPCERCGAINVEMHHEDYDQPLQVVWLCKRCHVATHRVLE